MEQKIRDYLSSVKALLNQGSANDVEKAILLLKKVEEIEQLGLENKLILLNSRLQENESDFYQKGISKRDDYKQEMAQIIYALLELTDDVSARIEDKIEKAEHIHQTVHVSNISSQPFIFLIYDNNQTDNVYAQELIAHLMPLESITKEITIGDMHYGNRSFGPQQAHWEEKIEQAALILCLISPSFFVSKNKLFDLAENAVKTEKVVVPILAKPTHHYANTFLGSLTALPSNRVFISNWADRDMAYTDIVNDIHRYIRSL